MMDSNLNPTCRLCKETTAELVNVFKNFEDSTIASILAQHFWFQISKNDGMSECVCEICWTNVKTFHQFYKRVEWLHGKGKSSVNWRVVNKTYSPSAIIQQEQSGSELSVRDFNIVMSDEKKLQLVEVINFYIKEEEENSDNDDNDDYKRDKNDDYQYSNERREIDVAGVEDESLMTETECKSSRGEEDTTDIQLNNGNKSAIQDSQISEFFTLKCNICSTNVKFDTFKEFKQHYREVHKVNGHLECCGTKLIQRHEVLKHIQHRHLNSGADIAKEDAQIREFFALKCYICSGDVKFDTFKEFKKHHKKVHKQKGFIKCCDRILKLRCNVLRHIQYHLQPEAYRCNSCGKQFYNQSTLQSHIDTHAPKARAFKCDQCQKSFVSAVTLKHHIECKHPSKDGETFSCDICKRDYPTKISLESHFYSVHRSAPFICDTCARVFKSKTNLMNHMEEHSTTTIRPKVQCNICGAWLKNKPTLNVHLKLHNSDFVKCPICEKVIRNKHSLSGHIRKTHGERRNQCTLCDKSFYSSANLKEHMAVHTGENLYSCAHCDKKFKSNANYYAHRKKAHSVGRKCFPLEKTISKN